MRGHFNWPRNLIGAVVSSVLIVTSLTVTPANGLSVVTADISTSAVELTLKDTSVTVKSKKPMWGKPAALYEVAPDQTLTLVRRFTPTQSNPTVTIEWLNSGKAYRLESPGLAKPVVFRLNIKSTTSTAKADTTATLPPGKVALSTVTMNQKNSEWYLSPYFFRTLGQTFQVPRPTTVTKAALHFSPAVTTLLTPEGVKLMKDPQNIDWSDPKTQGIEIFNDDPKYSFNTKATFRIFSGVKDGLAESLDTNSLTLVKQVTRNVKISHNGYLAFDLGTVALPTGKYLATITLDNVPKNVLTVFLDGRNFGGPKSKTDVYPQGQAYRAKDGSDAIFEQHDSKRQPVSSVGKDVFDPGDLVLSFIGR